MSGFNRTALAGCAFLALADTGVVALALPPILRELDTDVAGVAAVLGAYALVLALALLVARPLQRGVGTAATGVFAILLFAVGSLACGLADDLSLLLAARAVQAVGGAFLLITAYTLLSDDAAGTRLWQLAALVGTAAGPALGGALTQAFGWRSIFLIQAPAVLVALPACLRAPATRHDLAENEHAGDDPAPGTVSVERAIAGVALALLAGAIAAALFLTVLLLVSGWSVEPLAAAAAVSVVPLAALLTARVGGPPGARAVAGALLLAGGTAALAFLPSGSVAWVLAPQALVGLGMGLALPALAGELLPERDPRQAARLLSARHLGIALVLALLAPIAQQSIDTTLEKTREQGAALILDARIPPDAKLKIAPLLAETVETEDPRGGLDRTFADARTDIDGEDLAEYDVLRDKADETLVAGVIDGFAPAYLVGAGLALLAALALAIHPLARLPSVAAERPGRTWPAREGAAAAVQGPRAPGEPAAWDDRAPGSPADLRPPPGPPPAGSRRAAAVQRAAGAAPGRTTDTASSRGRSIGTALTVGALLLGLAVPAVYALVDRSSGPAEVVIADPCKDRDLPDTGGILGFVQDRALEALDGVACKAGSSREELVLALVDKQERKAYEREYGVDPRSVVDVAQLVFGG